MSISQQDPGQADPAGSSQNVDTPEERAWLPLGGIDANTAKFPARGNLGGEGIVVFRTQTGYRGTQRNCPHMQATLLVGELMANDTMVRCPMHVFTFRLSDGKGVNCPGFRIRIFEIKQEDGKFFGRAAN
jgi:nitrite reductase/ring-hydroxylating ferredoxin subunit